MNDLRHLFDVFLPIHQIWWAVFGQSFGLALKFLYNALVTIPPFAWLGAYGLAIIVLTIVIKTVLMTALGGHRWRRRVHRRQARGCGRRVQPAPSESARRGCRAG